LTEVNNEEPRKANSMEELELLMEVVSYKLDMYYETRPVTQFFAGWGLFGIHNKVTHFFTMEARKELEEVDYDKVAYCVSFSDLSW